MDYVQRERGEGRGERGEGGSRTGTQVTIIIIIINNNSSSNKDTHWDIKTRRKMKRRTSQTTKRQMGSENNLWQQLSDREPITAIPKKGRNNKSRRTQAIPCNYPKITYSPTIYESLDWWNRSKRTILKKENRQKIMLIILYFIFSLNKGKPSYELKSKHL